ASRHGSAASPTSPGSVASAMIPKSRRESSAGSAGCGPPPRTIRPWRRRPGLRRENPHESTRTSQGQAYGEAAKYSRRVSERGEQACLVGWVPGRRESFGPAQGRAAEAEESLEELRELAVSAGARVVGGVIQRGHEPDPATLVGRGKVKEILAEARALEADVVLFDHDLTPTQLRNLEGALDLRILDRTQLILEIFAARARSREGQLQVELAQLNYLLPRLAGRGTLLSRLGGGIGTRGPGEQQLEFDRRRI